MDTLDGYKLAYEEAAKIDAQISKLMERYSVDEPENKAFWLKFTRTVGTSLEVISDYVQEWVTVGDLRNIELPKCPLCESTNVDSSYDLRNNVQHYDCNNCNHHWEEIDTVSK